MNYKLSPSDLTFLYEGCRYCFYLKARHQIFQPSIPIPAIFSKISSLLENYYNGKRTEQLHKDLPPGTIIYGEEFVESQPIHFSGHKDTCFIKGRFDIVIKFDDGTYGVIDFKTSNPEGEHSILYSRQLHAYAYALENPAHGAIKLSPVSMLGLLYFYPTKVSQQSRDWLSFDSEIYLVEIKKDYHQFLIFIKEVLSLLESPDYPDSAQDCIWCNYISKIEGLDHFKKG